MVEQKYKDWIQQNVSETYGRCAEVTEIMSVVFPELIRVRGHYYCPSWGQRAHWWLVTDRGVVIDPTAEQFPSKGLGLYQQHEESDPEPTGKCPNCGAYCYNSEELCSPKCQYEYVAYCNNPF